MPAEFVSCVDALLKQGHDKGSAYAICTVQYKKRHQGHTPQQDMKGEHPMMKDGQHMMSSTTIDEIAAMGWLYEELKLARSAIKG